MKRMIGAAGIKLIGSCWAKDGYSSPSKTIEKK
jgi:hypothetical protein